MTSESAVIPSLAIGLIVVLCAWLYPRLNHWVYQRRVARESAAAQATAAARSTVEEPR